METHPESQPVPPAVPAEHPVSAQILVAEDPFVSSFLRTVLQKHGHKVVTGDAARASDLIRQGMAADIVITNQPEVFLEFAPILPMLYIAASPDHELASQFPICRILRKPFHNHELLAAVEQLTESVVP